MESIDTLIEAKLIQLNRILSLFITNDLNGISEISSCNSNFAISNLKLACDLIDKAFELIDKSSLTHKSMSKSLLNKSKSQIQVCIRIFSETTEKVGNYKLNDNEMESARVALRPAILAVQP